MPKTKQTNKNEKLGRVVLTIVPALAMLRWAQELYASLGNTVRLKNKTKQRNSDYFGVF